MAKPSLYDMARQDVEPLTDLLKAVMEVNWHIARAEREGWGITLIVDENDSRLSVSIGRDFNCWPQPAEPEAEEA